MSEAYYTADENNVWTVGENGLILNTENGGQSWNIQLIDTKKKEKLKHGK